MAKNTLELYDYIDDHDAERATSLLLNPNDKKLAQCLNGYDRATSTKKRRRRTALLAALCLIDQEIGVPSVGHAHSAHAPRRNDREAGRSSPSHEILFPRHTAGWGDM